MTPLSLIAFDYRPGYKWFGPSICSIIAGFYL